MRATTRRVPGGRGLRTGLAAVLAGILAATSACGGGDDDNGSSGGTIELTVDVFGEFGYEGLYKQYEASHPNIKIRQRKVAELDQFKPRLQQWMATGSGAGQPNGRDGAGGDERKVTPRPGQKRFPTTMLRSVVAKPIRS